MYKLQGIQFHKIKKSITDLKTQINTYPLIAGNVNNPLTPRDGSFEQKINRDTSELINITQQLHPNPREHTFYTFYSAEHGKLCKYRAHPGIWTKFTNSKTLKSFLHEIWLPCQKRKILKLKLMEVEQLILLNDESTKEKNWERHFKKTSWNSIKCKPNTTKPLGEIENILMRKLYSPWDLHLKTERVQINIFMKQLEALEKQG